jgi:hypothetical protein
MIDASRNANSTKDSQLGERDREDECEPGSMMFVF